MRIGILTLPLHTNYGGILQAYALQTVLERLGHDTVVINRKKTIRTKWYKDILSYPYRFIKKISGKKKQKIRWEVAFRREEEILMQNIRPFIKRNIKTLNIEEITDIDESMFDAIVVGSDQIWRKKYFCSSVNRDIAQAYLKFAKKDKIKRIAYAASFGTDVWEYSDKETKDCQNELKYFQSISVREASGITLCDKYFNKSAVQTLDPTLLLSSDDYKKLIGNISPSNNSLFVYVLDETEEIINFAEKVSQDKKLVKEFFYTKNNGIENTSVKSIESWLAGIMNAEFVITDSFHACVFSIIFRTPFIAVINKERGGARFETLSSLFNLKNNFIDNVDKYDKNKSYSISSMSINNLKKQKKLSIKFLQDSLNL